MSTRISAYISEETQAEPEAVVKKHGRRARLGPVPIAAAGPRVASSLIGDRQCVRIEKVMRVHYSLRDPLLEPGA
jgi:hypothetical protein